MSVAELESSIRDSVASMREAGATNDELIDEVVRKIFMLLGEHPTQPRVLDFLRQPGKSPSASTVQNGIKRFFNGIRNRMGGSLSHPSIPPEVMVDFSQGVARLWDLAMAGSSKAFEDYRKELEDSVNAQRHQMDVAMAEARASEQAAREEAQRANEMARADRQVAAEATDIKEQAIRDLGIATAEKIQLQSQVEEIRMQLAQVQSQAEQDRSRYASEIDSIRREYESKLEDGRAALRQLEERSSAEQNYEIS